MSGTAETRSTVSKRRAEKFNASPATENDLSAIRPAPLAAAAAAVPALPRGRDRNRLRGAGKGGTRTRKAKKGASGRGAGAVLLVFRRDMTSAGHFALDEMRDG